MRISLMHNPVAGDGVSFEEVHRDLEASGYEVIREVETDADLQGLIEDPVEFVVVAGGDGTVRKVGRALAGSGVPLAILPHGTANNIARSLGVTSASPETMARWRSGTRVPFDLGVARGQWGESRFLESVGAGLIPAGIATDEEHPGHGSGNREDELVRSLRSYTETLRRLQAWTWTVSLDGQPVQGELLLLEILNVPAVGANLALAPGAVPGDGLFDVVTAGESERGRLEEYLEARRKGGAARLDLPTRRARRVEVQGWERMHVDDEVRRIEGGGKVAVEIEPGALTFLV